MPLAGPRIPGAAYPPFDRWRQSGVSMAGEVMDRLRAMDRGLLRLLLAVGGTGVVVGMLLMLLLVHIVTPAAPVASLSRDVPSTSHATSPRGTATPARTAAAVSTGHAAATFVSRDVTTQGSWHGVYGSEGADLPSDAASLPKSITITPSGAAGYTWAGSTADARALQRTFSPSDRVAGCLYSLTGFSLDVNITDGQTHQLALYLLDWDNLHRTETIRMIDPATHTTLDSRTVTGFESGEYLVWNVRGHFTIQFTNDAIPGNAVVNGLFFGRS